MSQNDYFGKTLKLWPNFIDHFNKRDITSWVTCVQMDSVDKTSTERAYLPYNTETAQIFRPFDKEIPPSGRI